MIAWNEFSKIDKADVFVLSLIFTHLIIVLHHYFPLKIPTESHCRSACFPMCAPTTPVIWDHTLTFFTLKLQKHVRGVHSLVQLQCRKKCLALGLLLATCWCLKCPLEQLIVRYMSCPTIIYPHPTELIVLPNNILPSI